MNKYLMYKNLHCTTSESTDKQISDLYCDTDLEEFDSIQRPNEEFEIRIKNI